MLPSLLPIELRGDELVLVLCPVSGLSGSEGQRGSYCPLETPSLRLAPGSSSCALGVGHEGGAGDALWARGLVENIV